MILFQANTPAQLVNASVLAASIFKNDKCDLYYTSNLETQAKSLYEDEVFANIYEIELVADLMKRTSKISRMLVRIKNALDISKIKKNLPSNPLQYSRVFVAGVSLRNMEIFYAIKMKNKKVKLSLYEEGAFEYCELGMKKEFSKMLFSYLFFHQYYLKECDSLFVYKPDLVISQWPDIAIRKIPSLRKRKSLIPKINKAFGYVPTQLDGAAFKYVIMEQAFDDVKRDKEQIDLIKMVSDIVGDENVIVKLHPRSEKNKYGSSVHYLNTQLPFEIIALNEKIENNVFISITSSAITNFKVVLDMEPDILALYKIFSANGLIDGENEKFILRVKESCENENFYIPSDKKEFTRIIKRIDKEKRSGKCLI